MVMQTGMRSVCASYNIYLVAKLTKNVGIPKFNHKNLHGIPKFIFMVLYGIPKFISIVCM